MDLLRYLASALGQKIQGFFTHWYKDSFFFLSEKLHTLLRQLDKTFAVRTSAQYIFQPMYQDRSIIGYILGFIFRSIRIVVGVLLYTFLSLLWISAYIAFISLPIAIISWGIWGR
ncbi:MAG: hypothetical protein R3B52_01275 [Candidatus Paceibacterota bacterium]